MLIYIAIFVAKLVEVSLATVRNVLINRGEKVKGSLIAFFEVMLWVLVVGNVLGTLTEDPFKVFVYCLAFALGNYVGVTIENKLAIGTASIQAVIDVSKRDELSSALREKGFGVTNVKGEGMEGEVGVMMIYLKRKCIEEASALIRSYNPNAFITVNDVRQMRNGYMRK